MVCATLSLVVKKKNIQKFHRTPPVSHICFIIAQNAHGIKEFFFEIVNIADETDKATSGVVEVLINDNYQSFVEQKIDKALNKQQTKQQITI